MQQEEVGNIMRDREILCVCAAFCLSFFFVSYIRFFFQSDPVMKHPTRRKARQAISESRYSSTTSDFRLFRGVLTAFAFFLRRFSPKPHL
jgi:hypothetical protein